MGGGGGQVKFYPHKTKGGGGTTCFEVGFTRELEVLAILMGGGVKSFEKLHPVLRGRNKFWTHAFPIL